MIPFLWSLFENSNQTSELVFSFPQTPVPLNYNYSYHYDCDSPMPTKRRLNMCLIFILLLFLWIVVLKELNMLSIFCEFVSNFCYWIHRIIPWTSLTYHVCFNNEILIAFLFIMKFSYKERKKKKKNTTKYTHLTKLSRVLILL